MPLGLRKIYVGEKDTDWRNQWACFLRIFHQKSRGPEDWGDGTNFARVKVQEEVLGHRYESLTLLFRFSLDRGAIGDDVVHTTIGTAGSLSS